jgi:uncharacterized protein (DUF302 family)
VRAAIVIALLALFAAPAAAEQLLMARSTQAFPEAMLTLQNAIGTHGYTVSRVQRVDIGLTSSGFKTDKYRVVFFGKPAEIRNLSASHPELIPYLPLKATIFAERDQAVVVTANPAEFSDFVHDPKVHKVLLRWRRDLHAILDEVRNAER